jgi:hypothetical protein
LEIIGNAPPCSRTHDFILRDCKDAALKTMVAAAELLIFMFDSVAVPAEENVTDPEIVTVGVSSDPIAAVKFTPALRFMVSM